MKLSIETRKLYLPGAVVTEFHSIQILLEEAGQQLVHPEPQLYNETGLVHKAQETPHCRIIWT
jgi:hypothetical protein